MEKKRDVLLTIWLWLWLIAGTIGLFFSFSQRMDVLFGSSSSFWHYERLVLSILLFITIIFLFKWKRWAAYIFIGLPLVSLIFQLVRFGTRNHASALIILIFEIVISFVLIRRKWMLFE